MNHIESLNSNRFRLQDRHFKLINYHDIVMAMRGDTPIMCNGHVLLEEVMEDHNFGAYKKKVPKQGFGIVAYFGKPILEYALEGRFDPQDDLKKGDVVCVFKRDWNKVRYMEDNAHNKFRDKKYLIVHRYMLGAILEDKSF